MPLLYRDTRCPRSTTHRLPPWLIGQNGLQRVESDRGDIIGAWDAMIFHPSQLPDEQVWWMLADDFEVTQVGAFIPSVHLRSAHGLPLVKDFADSQGRLWHLPAILRPDSDPLKPASAEDAVPLLTLPWGRDAANAMVRVPTPQQALLITSARAVRREVLADTLSQVPLEVVAAWLQALIPSVYHLDLSVLLPLGLIDDAIGVRGVMISAGFYGPT